MSKNGNARYAIDRKYFRIKKGKRQSRTKKYLIQGLKEKAEKTPSKNQVGIEAENERANHIEIIGWNKHCGQKYQGDQANWIKSKRQGK